VTNLLIARTRGLGIVSQAEVIKAHATLRGNEALIATASYLAEDIVTLVPEEQAHDELFVLSCAALDLLDRGMNRHAVTFVFEMGLLRQLGYRPQLEPCTICQSSLMPESNAFSAESGVVCARCAVSRPELPRVSVNALKLLRAVDRGEIDRVLQLRVPPTTWLELEVALSAYIERIAGRQLGARRVLRELRLE
jgi:DNA repair protein RecO (recombination protein O)